MRRAAFLLVLAACSACTEAGYDKLDAWSDAVQAPGVFRPQPDMPALPLSATVEQLESYLAGLGEKAHTGSYGGDEGCERTDRNLAFSFPFERLANGVLGFDYESQSYQPGYMAYIDASGNVVCIAKRFAYQSFPSFGSPAS